MLQLRNDKTNIYQIFRSDSQERAIGDGGEDTQLTLWHSFRIYFSVVDPKLPLATEG